MGNGCTFSDCDEDGFLRDGPWGSGTKCPACGDGVVKSPEEVAAIEKRLEELLEDPSFKKNVEDLKAALEAGKFDAPPSVTPYTQLVVNKIDVSSWTEFKEGFFEKPIINSVLVQVDNHIINHKIKVSTPASFADLVDKDPYVIRKVYPCEYMSFVRDTVEAATAALRTYLLEASKKLPIVSFLALPSWIEVRTGSNIAGKRYAAFCFMHLATDMLGPEDIEKRLMTEDHLKWITDLGLKGFTKEGAISND